MAAIDFLGAGQILGAMITPALLISASGTLSLATSNRLGRVVDRIRAMTDLAESLPDGVATPEVAEKRALIADQIRWHTQRLRLLQHAVLALYTAIGLLVGSSLLVGISATSKWQLGWVPVAFGLAGACAMFVAAAMLIRESRLAVLGAEFEIEYVRRLVARKTAAPPPVQEKPEGGRGEG
jgi:hypothetical protein